MENLSSQDTKPFFRLPLAVLLLLLFFIDSKTRAAAPLDIAITEIAWMGTEASYNDEWIELYNNTDLALSVEGWTLKSADDTIKIVLSGTIPAHSFYLLERTDDSTVPDISADQVYKGALNNTGKSLRLLDSQSNLVDEVNCNQGWFEGNNSTKQTMERKNPQSPGNDSGNWQTSNIPGGTPKSQNSFTETESLEVETKEIQEVESPQSENERAKEEAGTINYPTGIMFSEILPSPEGPDAENEWIEIFNKNLFEVDLTDWRIKDEVGTNNTYVFPNNFKIKAKGFLVLSRKKTKITLNNSSDKVNLLSPNNKIMDSVSYKKAPLGESYSLFGLNWEWSKALTPGELNSPTNHGLQDNGSLEKIRAQSYSPPKEEQKNEGLASVKEYASTKTNFVSVFLTALFVSVFSAATIFFFKKKSEKVDFL